MAFQINVKYVILHANLAQDQIQQIVLLVIKDSYHLLINVKFVHWVNMVIQLIKYVRVVIQLVRHAQLQQKTIVANVI